MGQIITWHCAWKTFWFSFLTAQWVCILRRPWKCNWERERERERECVCQWTTRRSLLFKYYWWRQKTALTSQLHSLFVNYHYVAFRLPGSCPLLAKIEAVAVQPQSFSHISFILPCLYVRSIIFFFRRKKKLIKYSAVLGLVFDLISPLILNTTNWM